MKNKRKLKEILAKETTSKEDLAKELAGGMGNSLFEKIAELLLDERDRIDNKIYEGIKEEVRKNYNTSFSEFKKNINDELKKSKANLEKSFSSISKKMETLKTEVSDESFEFSRRESDSLEKRIDEFEELTKEMISDVGGKSASLRKLLIDITDNFTSQFSDIRKEISKKPINQEVSIRDTKSDKKTKKRLEDIFKKLKSLESDFLGFNKGVYEYGANLQVAANSRALGTAQGLNFKNGTNTTVTVTANLATGYFDVVINSSGGGSGTVHTDATLIGDGSLLDPLGLAQTPVNNEIVDGSGNSWNLANTPIIGSEHIYAEGQRLTPGVENDYFISGTEITTANSYPLGSLLADYRK